MKACETEMKLLMDVWTQTHHVVYASHWLSFTQTLYKGHNSTDSVVIIACCDRGGFRIGARGDWTG